LFENPGVGLAQFFAKILVGGGHSFWTKSQEGYTSFVFYLKVFLKIRIWGAYVIPPQPLCALMSAFTNYVVLL
jgi:hypothetical protein